MQIVGGQVVTRKVNRNSGKSGMQFKGIFHQFFHFYNFCNIAIHLEFHYWLHLSGLEHKFYIVQIGRIGLLKILLG